MDGFSELRYFEENDFLLDSIADLTSRDTLITVMPLTPKTWIFLRHISNTKAVWGTIRIGDVPVPTEESSFKSRLEKLIRKPSTGINFILQKLPLARFGFRPLDFILLGGAAPPSGSIARMKGANTRILDAHSFDYDSHLRAANSKEEVIPPRRRSFFR